MSELVRDTRWTTVRAEINHFLMPFTDETGEDIISEEWLREVLVEIPIDGMLYFSRVLIEQEELEDQVYFSKVMDVLVNNLDEVLNEAGVQKG